MVEEPPNNYSFIPPDVQLPGTKWLDNHRPVFSVNVEAVTSVHTLDSHLDRFISLCEYLDSRKVPPRIGEGNMEKELKKSLLEIQKSELEFLVKNLPVIFDKLIELLVTTYKISGQMLAIGSTVFETLCLVSEKLASEDGEDHHGRNSLLATYIQFQSKIPHPFRGKQFMGSSQSADVLGRCSSNTDLEIDYSGRSLDRSTSMKNEESVPPTSCDGQVRLLHEEIALHWVVKSGTAASDLSMNNSWMLFEVIIKSMIEHLDFTNLMNSPRKNRFPHQYTDDLSTLIQHVITKVIDYHNTQPKLAQSLNASLAFFIFDLFSIMDRGFVFGLIKTYYKGLKSKSSDNSDLIHYKLEFLRIICSHEHYVALNLPFATPFTVLSSAPCSPTPSATSNNSQNSHLSNVPSIDRTMFSELSLEFRQQHFLVGMVLSELATVLEIS